MKTVAIPMKTVAKAMRTVVMQQGPQYFLGIFGTQSVSVRKYSILRELSFITLPAFPFLGNQKESLSERAAHLTSSFVRQERITNEKSQTKIDQNFRRNRKTTGEGGYCHFNIFEIYLNNQRFK